MEKHVPAKKLREGEFRGIIAEEIRGRVVKETQGGGGKRAFGQGARRCHTDVAPHLPPSVRTLEPRRRWFRILEKIL